MTYLWNANPYVRSTLVWENGCRIWKQLIRSQRLWIGEVHSLATISDWDAKIEAGKQLWWFCGSHTSTSHFTFFALINICIVVRRQHFRICTNKNIQILCVTVYQLFGKYVCIVKLSITMNTTKNKTTRLVKPYGSDFLCNLEIADFRIQLAFRWIQHKAVADWIYEWTV